MLGNHSGIRFIEFIIAATIGSIVGAYISRDIEFGLNLVMRAVFSVAILSVFFFLVYKVSSSWGRKKEPIQKEEEIPEPIEQSPEEYPEEGIPEERP